MSVYNVLDILLVLAFFAFFGWICLLLVRFYCWLIGADKDIGDILKEFWDWISGGLGKRREQVTTLKSLYEELSPDKVKDKISNDVLEHIRTKGYFGEEMPNEIDEVLDSVVSKVATWVTDWSNLRADSNLRKCIDHFFTKEDITEMNVGSLKKYVEELETSVAEKIEDMKSLLGAIFSRLQYPKQTFEDNEVKFYAYLYEYVSEFNNVMGFISDAHRHGNIARSRLVNLPLDKEQEFLKLCRKANVNKQELISNPSVRKSVASDIFHMTLPFAVPFPKRFEHCHILAGTGHGKTQLLLGLIYNDLLKAQEGKGGLCVIDSQNDLIDTITRLSLFDPAIENSLADKLVLVNPNDVEHPVSLNIFDIKVSRLNQMEASHREMALNFAISLYGYIFSDLLEGKLTMYQENIFQFCAKLLLGYQGTTLLDFIELLEKKDAYQKYLSEVDEMTTNFFRNEFFSSVYESTKKQISARLWSVVRNNTFKNMFVNEENKIDMFEAMNQGKIVLINTSKMLLQSGGAKMLGKFFIALISQSTLLRASIPEDRRRSFFVYIDEAQDYLTDALAEFLTQARKYRVGLILAHQYLKQLDDVSLNLKYGTLANTSVKFVGKVDLSDARAMGERVGVSPEGIMGLRKKDRDYTEYFCWVKDTTPEAVKVRVPLGVVNQKEIMPDDSFDLLIQNNRQRYCVGLPAQPVKPKLEVIEGGFQLGKPKKIV